MNLAKELLVEYEGKFLLSEKFSQDPLEEHFTRQRRRGGCCENPSSHAFGNQELLLNVVQSNLIKEMKGNTRGTQRDDPKIDIHDHRKLPTKKKVWLMFV